jgi:hypothetical protein
MFVCRRHGYLAIRISHPDVLLPVLMEFIILFPNIIKPQVPLLSIEAGVIQSVQCLTTDCTNGVRSPAEANDFSSSLYV